MSKPNWTEEQLAAILLRGQLLVAAAAGSGKTAVLVERIIRQVIDADEPADVDRFLVVTFTKAAANEMRERIGKVLDEAIFVAEDSEVERLLRQRTLLPRANITTLHSFCSEIIRKYFYILELDPAFRIADQAEADLIKQDVIEALFESKYNEEDVSFLKLVNAFGSDRDDLALMEHVIHLHEFAHSHLQPNEWLSNLNVAYQWDTVDSLMKSQWGEVVRQGIINKVSECLNLLDQAKNISVRPGGPAKYFDTIQSEINNVQMLLKSLTTCDWSKVEEQYPLASNFSRLPALSFKSKKLSVAKEESGAQEHLIVDESIQKLLQEECKDLRESAKKKLKSLKEEVFTFSLQQQIPWLQKMGDLAQSLGNLVIEFSHNYALAKSKRNVLDFTDLEHFALRLLEENGQASIIAKGLKERFYEVLVDEYQDINSVQERILQLVSRTEITPNLFMVGDVKQSIYRFRMADPGLFLAKYNDFPHWKPKQQNDEQPSKLVIDLNRNFRSRLEVVKGVNFIFRQIMTNEFGEISYDEHAALQYGASFMSGEEQIPTAEGPIEVHLIDSKSIKNYLAPDETHEVQGSEDIILKDQESQEDFDALSKEDLDNARIEARFVSDRIQELVQKTKLMIYDNELKNFRQVRYSDIVVLMRSYSAIAPVYVEEFQKASIPVYAETSTGYFGASEVDTILSLLKIIDNPHFDIPMAAVLRSQLVNLNGSELGKVRLMLPKGDFYEALTIGVWAGLSEHNPSDEIIKEISIVLNPYEQTLPQLLEKAKEILSSGVGLKEKIIIFWLNLQKWRTHSRQTSLAELIWSLYEETGYLAYVGTLPSGPQRQANLRVLYDRACRFEETRYRGLFRFLRFLDRFQGQGKDMGNARVLGEKENVVRLITVHASKGLEFPFVFVVGLGRAFNTQSLKERVLLHSKLGLGIPIIDVENYVRYPSIIQYAVKHCLAQEALAEELRILYVALTRAKERLFLYGTVDNFDNALRKWLSATRQNDVSISDGLLRNAKCFLDWIGPALARHPQYFFGKPEELLTFSIPEMDSKWEVSIHNSWETHKCLDQENSIIDKVEESQNQNISSNVQFDTSGEKRTVEQWYTEVDRRLGWQYPYNYSVSQAAKTSVSELKRQYSNHTTDDSLQMFTLGKQSDPLKRPKFIQTVKSLTAAERGTALHTAMQHIPIQEWAAFWPNLDSNKLLIIVDDYLEMLVQSEILTYEQRECLRSEQIVQFLNSSLGQRLFSADQILREIPFNLSLKDQNNEGVLVQGVIDVVMLSKNGQQTLNAEILDYKTDFIHSNDIFEQEEIFRDRYTLQLALYSLAIERLLKIKVTRCTLYSFYLGKEISINTENLKEMKISGLTLRV